MMSDIREIDSFSIEYKLLEFHESGRTALCIPVKDPLHKNCWISVDNILKRAHNITYKGGVMEWKVGDTFKSLITSKIYKILYIDDIHVLLEFKCSLGGPDKSLWRVASLYDFTRFERYDPNEIKVGDKLMSTGRGQFCNKNVYEVLYVSKENAVVIKEGSTKYLAIEVFMPLSQLKDQDLFKRVS